MQTILINYKNKKGCGGSKIVSQVCGMTSHDANKCYQLRDILQGMKGDPSAMMAQGSGSGEGTQKNVNWLLDFRAPHHITNNENIVVENNNPFLGDDTNPVGNGSSLTIKSHGSTCVKSSNFVSVFQLHDIKDALTQSFGQGQG